MVLKKKIIVAISSCLVLIGVLIGGYVCLSHNKPYFSIIVSSYNYGHYLPQTIESILKSSYDNFELIVVNDGSTDKTSFILKQYKNHPKITIIEHENQGLSLSRNKAMKIAKGKYFWFVDADDWIDKQALQGLYDKTKETSPDIVSFYTSRVNEHGMFLGMGGYDLLPWKLENNMDNILTIDDLSVGDLKSYPVTSGKQIYRREFTLENKIEFPAKTLFEDDVFFFHHIFAGARISPFPKMLYYKRAHGGAITSDKGKHFDSYVRISQYIWERTHKYPQHEEKANQISSWYIDGIRGRWWYLSQERKYKFYPDLLKFKEFIDAQENSSFWIEKRKDFNEFFNSPDTQRFKTQNEEKIDQ